MRRTGSGNTSQDAQSLNNDGSSNSPRHTYVDLACVDLACVNLGNDTSTYVKVSTAGALICGVGGALTLVGMTGLDLLSIPSRIFGGFGAIVGALGAYGVLKAAKQTKSVGESLAQSIQEAHLAEEISLLEISPSIENPGMDTPQLSSPTSKAACEVLTEDATKYLNVSTSGAIFCGVGGALSLAEMTGLDLLSIPSQIFGGFGAIVGGIGAYGALNVAKKTKSIGESLAQSSKNINLVQEIRLLKIRVKALEDRLALLNIQLPNEPQESPNEQQEPPNEQLEPLNEQQLIPEAVSNEGSISLPSTFNK